MVCLAPRQMCSWSACCSRELAVWPSAVELCLAADRREIPQPIPCGIILQLHWLQGLCSCQGFGCDCWCSVLLSFVKALLLQIGRWHVVRTGHVSAIYLCTFAQRLLRTDCAASPSRCSPASLSWMRTVQAYTAKTQHIPARGPAGG